MKLNALTAATLAALYSAGIAASATPVANNTVMQQINKAQLQHQSAQQLNKSGRNQIQPMPIGVNQQVTPASSKIKFIEEPDRTAEDVYIVRLRDLPVSTYDGRISGLAATAPRIMQAAEQSASGWTQMFNQSKAMVGLNTDNQTKVKQYQQYLQTKQQQVIQAAQSKGIHAAPRLNYTQAINGFSITLTQAQAKAMAELPQVAYVQRSKMKQIQSDRGPEFIGAGAIWQGTTSTGAGLAQQGENMVIGVLDTGINTDHPSFADVGADGYDHTNPLGSGNYLGDCATGTLTCNDKLIGVYSWPVITDSYQGIRPASGEDYQGHGSHTASTAAGNVVFNAPLVGSSLGDGDGLETGFSFDRVSGVAPHANIIAYQVCFPNDGCPDEAILMALEQAIIDEVDVINFSIGGAEPFPWEDAEELAFLSAREAGIAVAQSAGNAGPGFYTMLHSAPWVMTVAATTHDRELDISKKTLTLSGDTTPPEFPTYDYTEFGGISKDGISGRLVNAADFGDELCANAFPAMTFSADQIVICKRGDIARVQKAFNVQAGGAGGFILYNAGYPTDDDGLVNDVYPLPGVQLHSWDGQQLVDWLADGGTNYTATIPATEITRTLNPDAADKLAEFSSIGPSNTYEGLLVPHISAPGVNIFAAYADEHPFNPDSADSRDWALLSGTSMASPHIAGAMALLKQAHPDWSAAEIQSALQMTAVETVSYGATEWDPTGKPAGIYRAGAGRVNVAAAVDSGLVMDETAANFLYANPHNGGDVKQLNLPQLVNNHCRNNCNWIRTVKATRDGSWTVTNGDWTYDRWNTGQGELAVNGASIVAFPSTFSLKAGETQTILFRADLTDSQFKHNAMLGVTDANQIELWSSIHLTPADNSMPSLHWPVSMNIDHGGLPTAVNVEMHRDDGAYKLTQLPLPAMDNVLYRATGLTKASVENVTLSQDSNHIPIWFDGDYAPGHNKLYLIDVPENSARIVVDTVAKVKSAGFHEWYGPMAGALTIYIGKDSNGNGEADFDDELLCTSATEIELNYCSITQPDAGQYWVMLSNVRTNAPDDVEIEGLEDTYSVAMAVVPASGTGLDIAGPVSSDGTPVDIDLTWSISDMAPGDIAYAGFDIGSVEAPGSVGFIPVKLSRGVNDVSVKLNQTRANGGEVLDVVIHALQNNSGADRDIDLTATLAPGMTLVPGSVKVNNPRQQANLNVTGNVIQVAGVQENSESWQRTYAITTNETDRFCRTPNYSASSTGGFVGLYKNFGFTPDIGGSATDWLNPEFKIPLSNYWGDEQGNMNLFHNEDYRKYSNLIVSPQGYATLEQFWDPTQHIVHTQFPYFASPFAPFIGVMWKGVIDQNSAGWNVAVDALGTPLNVDLWNAENTSGITLGYAKDPANEIDDLIVEWVNARTQSLEVSWFGADLLDEKSDRYNFNLIVSKGYRYGAGQFELIMAYGDIDFNGESGVGSIGLHGNYGPLDIFGFPYGQETGLSFAYNNLDSTLKKDLVVCYDYVGPESTQFDLSFKVRLAETASGKNLPITIVSNIDGMGQQTLTPSVSVSTNLQLAAISAKTVEENTTLRDIAVFYSDSNNTPNIISVSGANITAVVHGNESGASIDLTPAVNFEGTTDVTVTVTDSANSSDSVSTHFVLTVTPGNNIVVTPPPVNNTVVKKDSGSFGWWMFGALSLMLLRRRNSL